MTTQTIYSHPSPSCRCHDCVVEFVKDWEDDYPISSNDEYYNDEYTGAWGTYSYSDWN